VFSDLFNVDILDPVSNHDLNVGLTAWWLGLPGQSGGWGSMLDLRGRFHGVSENGCVFAFPRPEGFGFYDTTPGTNTRVNVGSGVPVSTGDFTASAWVYPTANPGAGLVSRWWGFHRDGWPFPGWSFGRATSGSGMSNSLYVWDGTSWKSFGADWTLNVWQHTILRVSGTTATAFVNGVAVGSPVTLAARSSWSGNRAIAGTAESISAGKFTGYSGDYRLYDGRALSDADCWSLYVQSLRGHPDTLRRSYSRVSVIAGPPSAAAPVWVQAAVPVVPDRQLILTPF